MQAYRRTNRQTFSNETSSERHRVEGFELRPDLERLRMMQVRQDRQRLCPDQAGCMEATGGHVGVAEVVERHREVEAAAHLPLEREMGSRFNLARALAHLGDTHLSTGDLRAAHLVWAEALTILADLHHPEAFEVREKLESLNPVAL